MAAKKKVTNPSSQVSVILPGNAIKEPAWISFVSSPRNQCLILIFLVLLLYGNTLGNLFALDDGLVLRDNSFVQEGIKGIPDILKHDSFYGSIGQSENLSGGRYRPLSLVAFAIELSVFGKDPWVFHLMNILYYALTAVILLLFLRRFIFINVPLAAFSAALLWAIHPVHTEVVANIKSRDEIFSLLFLLLTLYCLLLYTNISHQPGHLLLAMSFYVLALFSKENGLTFVFILPLTLYFFSEEKISRIIAIAIPFVIIAAIYVAIRISLIGLQNNEVKGVLDNPYVLATGTEKYATIVLVFLKYIQLLFLPYPLTYDYSYNQIVYRNFADPMVLLSLLLNAGLLVYALMRFQKRDIISYCILFYFASLLIVSNLLFNVGAPMAERFLFQPSVAFVIAITEAGRRLFQKAKWDFPRQFQIVSAGLAVIVFLSAFEVIPRNIQWKSDDNLFLHDVKISSESARANAFAGVALVRRTDQSTDSVANRKLLNNSLTYFNKSIAISSDYIISWLNLGVAYIRLDSFTAAENAWNKARSINASDNSLKQYDSYLADYYYKKGLIEGANKNFENSITYLVKAVKYAPLDADKWYNLGGAYFSMKNYAEAKTCWQKALQINPQYQQAMDGLNAVKQMGY